MSRHYPLQQLACCLPLTIRSAFQAARRGTIHYLHRQDAHGRPTRALWADLDELEIQYRNRPELLGKILERLATLDLEQLTTEAAQG